ncbi:MAG: anhydro-N-acetylmuramic acid kinase [Gammaproteobacteria bacterium]|nr:MAG: anhydro-N-acetylmuramic acid kinase [Gammaproteobacteria bacterium]
MTELYIGLMSGTSADGIDAALVDFSQTPPVTIATHYQPYSPALREQILALCVQGENEIHRLGELDVVLGSAFAEAVNHLLQQQSLAPSEIKAIGSHGQTVRHAPSRFTLQVGDPNTIAAKTGITTIADFRRKDIAHGGQGAPLLPAFHHHLFATTKTQRVIVNIGGIANVTLLSSPIIGFDTGPGNVLMDAWIGLHQQQTHDKDGAWAAQGQVHPALLERLLADTYFHLPPPKSTGREYFHLAWLQQYLETPTPPQDVQATLAELTARSILLSIQKHQSVGEILICGGGAHNTFLMQRLQQLAEPHYTVDSTQKYGIHPDWVEAIAFAWLARQTLLRQPGNLPSVTGAHQAVILGGIYQA